MKKGISTDAKYQLDDGSLIKWDNKNNKEILSKARKLIWIAYNSERQPEARYETLSLEFDAAWREIEIAEENLYTIINRHQESEEVKTAEQALQTAIEHFQNRMPSVFDPFAGGGAIPLEAARLGCRSYGNDINPVAHIIEKGSVEFPQKYGKPIRYTREEFSKIYGNEGFQLLTERNIPQGKMIEIPNRLSFDVEFYCSKLIKLVRDKTDHLYYINNKGQRPAVYYWHRYAKCCNPNCNKLIPLFKQYYLSKPRANKIEDRIKHFNLVIENNNDITINIENGDTNASPIINRGNLVCPFCGGITDVQKIKEQFINKQAKESITALIYETSNGKIFDYGNKECLEIFEKIPENTSIVPQERLQPNSAGGDILGWGFYKWGELFNKRQLIVLNEFCNSINNLDFNNVDQKYFVVIKSYLAILVDRIAVRATSFGKWHVLQDTVEHLYGRQAIQMNFDYPEMDPFSDLSGSAYGQLSSIINYLEEESNFPFHSKIINVESGDKEQFKPKTITATITDPPYYDAIAYADISDFFYVWLKRTLGDIYPLNFATPQTPKMEECTALKHHHNNNIEKAKKHFENKLLSILKAIEAQTNDIVSIMFAHQSTEAWTTLCNSILGAQMNITGSWATDTEMTGALKTDKAFLESSVTVSCRPSQRTGIGNYRKVKQAIENKVAEEVESLYQLGFRGADLLTACFGQAVSEFGKYETVEKADGSQVTVGELLEMARMAAFNALLKGFDGDEYTRFYIGWLQMNGMGDTDFDDAAKFARIGVSMNIDELFKHKLLIKAGNKQHLASYRERITLEHQGFGEESLLIDQVQQAMSLWQKEDRAKLLQLIKITGSDVSGSFWRVLASLKELLPEGDDLKQVNGLLSNRDDLIRDAKRETKHEGVQGNLNFE